MNKPLGRKAYGSIPHLSTSLLGPGDHRIHEGQERIATARARKGDTIIITEKLDGSNGAIARINGRIIPLTRSGYHAASSPYLQHHLFADWVLTQQERFLDALVDGEWLSGEWLAQAHGTRMILQHEPFVVFDLWVDGERTVQSELRRRAAQAGLILPRLIHEGPALSVDAVKEILDSENPHGVCDDDEIEGAVWRCENSKGVDFLTKWVRPTKVNGKYLPEISGGETIWNENLEQYLPEKCLKKLKCPTI